MSEKKQGPLVPTRSARDPFSLLRQMTSELDRVFDAWPSSHLPVFARLAASESNAWAPNRAGNLGFDAASGKYVDLIEAGIIDPTKVVRLALENAVSVAGVLLLTEATMTEVPDAKAQAGTAGADADL